MNRVNTALLFLLSSLLWPPAVHAVEPFIQFGVGVMSRDVVEEDPSIIGFKFDGRATSTRVLTKAGANFGDILSLYLVGGGADLSVDEFNRYDGTIKGAFGGGLRLNLYRSPYRDRFTLFVEGNTLRSTTDDRIEFGMDCTAANDCAVADGLEKRRFADETIQWAEYTVLLGASSRYADTGPYGGIRLSNVDGTDRILAPADSNFITDFKVKADVQEDSNFGIFLGLDIFMDRTEKTALNFEVTLIDQDSFMASIRRSF